MEHRPQSRGLAPGKLYVYASCPDPTESDLAGLSQARECTKTGTALPSESRIARNRKAMSAMPIRLTAQSHEDEGLHHSAELFYLQKQIQAQTLMVIVLEDGERVEGCIEWYDRRSLKVRGKSRTLIYKSAIRYMYKHGENVQ